MIESPDISVLEPVEWQFFGSFTFKREHIPERVRLGMWFALARIVCKWHHVYFPRLLWALRQESGELGDRLHFHALIGGVPARAVQTRTCFAIMAAWESVGGGMARVRVYDSSRNGAAYILECLSNEQGMNAYESAKFGSARCHLIVAKSVKAVGYAAVRRGFPGQDRQHLGVEDVSHTV